MKLLLVLLILIPSIASHFLQPSEDQCDLEHQKAKNCTSIFDGFSLFVSNHSAQEVKKLNEDFMLCVGEVHCPRNQLKLALTEVRGLLNEKFTSILNCTGEGRYNMAKFMCMEYIGQDCFLSAFIQCTTEVLENTGACSPTELNEYKELKPFFEQYCRNKFALRN